MHQQTIRNRQPDALRGAGLILLVAAAVVAGSMFFSRLEASIGRYASLGFIAYGCLIAWLLLDWYVLAFVYTANGDVLRVCRLYGKRERLMTDVWFSTVKGYGEPENVKKCFPGARVSQAVRAQCEYAPLALAYTQNDRTEILVIQPDDAMRAHLLDALRGKKSKSGGTQNGD